MLKPLKSIKSLKNKTVLVRVDFNVPFVLKNNGKIKITSDFKIRKTLPTIKYLLKEGARIILVSHLGRPEGKEAEFMRMKPIARRFSKLIKHKVEAIDTWDFNEIKKIVGTGVGMSSPIFFLENIRFKPEEKKGNLKFAKQLAGLADIYVNDGFGVCHRPHASVVGITKYLPSYSGLLLEEEVRNLTKVLTNAEHPFVAVIGGAKIETKLPLIEAFLKKCDYVLVGGNVANEMIAQKIAARWSKELASKVILPVDFVVWDHKQLDIGDKTIKKFTQFIQTARTVIWNGPMGMFEDVRFKKGTYKIAKAIAKSSAYTVAGGGESMEVLERLKLTGKISFLSTGGGAALEFLAGKELPGLET